MQLADSEPPDLSLAAADIRVLTRPPKSLWRETLESLLRKPSAILGLILLGILTLIAIFAPLIATHDPLSVLIDIPEEGVIKRMDACIHLLGCHKAGEDIVRLSTDTNIQFASLSGTGSMMFASSGSTVTIWSADSGKQLMKFDHDNPVTAAAFSPNDQKMLTASGGELFVWDVSKRTLSKSVPVDIAPNFIAWNADGSRFLTSSAEQVQIWDTLSWKPTATIPLDGPRIAAAWNSNGTVVMTASGKSVKLWNAFSGTQMASLEHEAEITSANLNGASSQLLTTSGHKLHVWDVNSFKELTSLEYEGELANGAWSENISRGIRRVMATSGDKGLVWDISSGRLILELPAGEPLLAIKSSPYATRIFTQSAKAIQVWDANGGARLLTIQLDTPVTEAAWQSTGGGIIIASENDLRVVKTSNYQYIMGVDGNLRDQFSRVIYGTRVSLVVGLLTVTLAVVVGTISGAVAGYMGGWMDNAIMRIMDVMLAFPPLILAIAVVTVLGPGLINALLAISIVFIPAYARVARSGVLAVKEEDYVMADRVLGVGPVRILFRRILPNALSPLIVQATLGIGTAILDAAALSFLGLGAQAPTPEWGAMLGAERNQIFTAPHLVFYPGIAIMITVLAFNLLGDGLRDALDPRLD